jgi:hypothetical protein
VRERGFESMQGSSLRAWGLGERFFRKKTASRRAAKSRRDVSISRGKTAGAGDACEWDRHPVQL